MSANTVIHRIVRPAVRALAPTGITPNQITTARIVTGIAAAIAFSWDAGWQNIGGAIFLFSMLLDRADGELARQTGQSSPAGHRYDLISDCLSNVIAFIGLGFGQMAALGLLGTTLGFLAGAAVATLFWQLHILRIGEVQSYELARGITIDPDDLMALVPVLIWVGATIPMLWAAAVITPLAALFLGLSARKPRSTVRPPRAS